MFMQMLALAQEWYVWFGGVVSTVGFFFIESFHQHSLYHYNNWYRQKFGRLFLGKTDTKYKCQEASFINIKAASTETQLSVLLLVHNAQLKHFFYLC